jgi:hypothetical protein
MTGRETRAALQPGATRIRAVAKIERFLAARAMRSMYHGIAFLKSFVS